MDWKIVHKMKPQACPQPVCSKCGRASSYLRFYKIEERKGTAIIDQVLCPVCFATIEKK